MKKMDSDNVGEDTEKSEPSHIADGDINGAAVKENTGSSSKM